MSSAARPSLLQLDHVTIIAPELELLRDFLCDVASLGDGPRPPFRSVGHWLYAGDQPAVHLVRREMPSASGPRTPRIDHFALRVSNDANWHELLRRLNERGIPFKQLGIPASNERQLFVSPSPGFRVEFVMSNGFA